MSTHQQRYPNIEPADLIPIGRLKRLHGHAGQMIAEVYTEALAATSPRFVFIQIDGLHVPFTVTNYRGSRQQLHLTLQEISEESIAKRYIGCALFLHPEELPTADHCEESTSIPYFMLIGLRLVHSSGSEIGTITEVDDSTSNILLQVSTAEGAELILPFVPEWIEEIKKTSGEIVYHCPEALTKPL